MTAAELSAAVGVPVTTETGPSGDCEFDQEDPRALSGSVGLVPGAEENGGLPAYLSGLRGSLTAPTEHQVAGLGDGATVLIGKGPMSENLSAGGAVDNGSYLVVVTLVQSKGDTDQHLAGVAERLLRVVDAKAGQS